MRSAASQLSLHKLEVFCEVAETGSVSRAAERLGLAQPVVTTHVRALAEKLGCRLTERQGRRLLLTEDGRRVHAWARELVRRTREIEREIADRRIGHAGRAAVAASMTVGSYVLPRHLVAFRRDHPEAELALQVTSPSAAVEAVRDGESDFAFSILDPGQDLTGLSVAPVTTEPLVLVGAPDRHPPGARVALRELPELGFVTAQAGTARREIEEHALLSHGVGHRRIAMELGHAEAIKQAVRSGAGVGFLFASSLRDELAAGTLTAIEVPGLRLEVPVYSLCRADKRLSAFQQGLMGYLVAALDGGSVAGIAPA